ncbi:MAG TPA: hypothetical protein VN847_16465 [Streptosporangiaceae bacterium]|nr:hypothetical protein [Streptosporangiaceae bacterium]
MTASNGAEVGGAMAVTPGETLVIGIGIGNRGGINTPYTGGWGPTINGDNYSGGDIIEGGYQRAPQPGGGATVIADQDNGAVLVVAGGGVAGGLIGIGSGSDGGAGSSSAAGLTSVYVKVASDVPDFQVGSVVIGPAS